MTISRVVCVSPLRCALRRLEPMVDQVSVRFFDRLLTSRPDLAPHFATMAAPHRRRMLLTALLLAVESEEEPGVMERTLHGFGRRHFSLDLGDDDFDFFGKTMRFVLAESLAAAWTAPVEAAWDEAFRKMVEAMKVGRREMLLRGHAGAEPEREAVVSYLPPSLIS